LVAAVVAVLGATAVFVMPVPPFGRYSEDRIATADDCYYSFTNGNMVLSIPNHADQVQGRLVRTNGHWMVLLKSGPALKLKPRLLFLEIEEGGPQFISRSRRYFGIKWIDWVVQKFI
jgi:hypothetical protein